MSEPDAQSPPPESAERPPAAPAARAPARPRRRGGLLWLLLLLAMAALAVLGWREYERYTGQREAADAWRARAEALEHEVSGLAQTLEATRRTQRTLAQRLDDSTATNKLLREELLAITERAALLEDSIGRLAEQRLRGEMLLKLNEAEFLLLMGAERLTLFGDVEAALQAYRLADATLASMEDPLAASLRETLAQELSALNAVPDGGPRRARAELDAAAAMLAELPEGAALPEAEAPEGASRLQQLLAQVVSIRRVDAGSGSEQPGRILDPAVRAAARAALSLDLAVARAAADRRDDLALDAALMRAQSRLERLFDIEDPRVARIGQSLAAVAALELSPALPALGATLRELRGVRAARGTLPPASRPPEPATPEPGPPQPGPAAPAPEPES